VVSIFANGRRRIDGAVSSSVPAAKPEQVIDGSIPTRSRDLRISRLQIPQRDDGGNRLASALHDEPLAGGSFVQHLAKLGPNLERRDGSHSAMMVISESCVKPPSAALAVLSKPSL
jgi:hypothetical protein